MSILTFCLSQDISWLKSRRRYVLQDNAVVADVLYCIVTCNCQWVCCCILSDSHYVSLLHCSFSINHLSYYYSQPVPLHSSKLYILKWRRLCSHNMSWIIVESSRKALPQGSKVNKEVNITGSTMSMLAC